MNSFVRFLEEIDDPKNLFKINLPLVNILEFRCNKKLSNAALNAIGTLNLSSYKMCAYINKREK